MRETRKILINMRTTAHEKEMLQEASKLAGFTNLTNFILTTVRKEAMRIHRESHITYLSPEDWKTVNDLINNPPEPNDNLKKLLSDQE